MLAASAQADSQQEAELPESPTSPPLPEAVQEKLDAAALLVAESDRRRLLILLAILALLFGAGLAIVLAIWL
jgi:hypothetical protein